ncbi:hypothetical protein RKD42_006737 [Streptomyces ambofaciens]
MPTTTGRKAVAADGIPAGIHDVFVGGHLTGPYEDHGNLGVGDHGLSDGTDEVSAKAAQGA